MNGIARPDQKAAANRLRNLMSVYRDNEDLISIGAYKSGSNPVLDDAMAHMDRINEFLVQATDSHISFEETIELMKKAVE